VPNDIDLALVGISYAVLSSYRKMGETPMNIGERLLELRTARNLSQGDIEKRTGLLRCYVSRVENGHTIPSLETLQRWAHALDVEVYQLFFEGEGKLEPAVADEIETSDRRERELLALFRQVNEADRQFMLEVGRSVAMKAA
jgi:transcriptional regulator with XRE-family HTH domain